MPIFISMGHIYQVRNIINDAVYIGSILKREPRHRWNAHKRDLRGNYHHSPHLQRAWNKYGESNFVFEILEKVDGDVLPREQWYLDNRKKNYLPKLNYNVCWIAGNCQGRTFTKSSLQKMSKSHIGQKQTPKAKAQQQATWAKKCKRPYSFASPDGVVYNNVKNLRAFGREHGIDATSLRFLWSGRNRYSNGWTKTGVSLPQYELRSPNGTISRGMLLKTLCINAEVRYKSIHRRCIKQHKPHKGWMAKCLA